jgi:hypothetical protein
MADAAPQRAAHVASHLPAGIEAIAGFAQSQQWPARPAAITHVRTPVPALAARVDVWWAGVRQALEPAAVSPLWRHWADEGVLPLVSGEPQGAHTRWTRRQATLRQALEARPGACDQQALTPCLPPQALKAWHAGATHRVSALQRPSSAVEGRTGSRSHMHHQHRGLPKRRSKVWTVLQNCACRAADGTTPASRFFQRTFPDLFETVVSHIETLPQPRRRKHQVALRPCSHESVPP